MNEDYQWWLSLGYNLVEDHLEVHFQGVDVNNLEVEEDNEIYMNKVVKNENGTVLQQLFYAIQNNQMHVIIAEHHRKVKKTELKFEKAKVIVRNKKLTDPNTFPLKL